MNTMKDIVTLLSKTQPLSPTLRWAESISPASVNHIYCKNNSTTRACIIESNSEAHIRHQNDKTWTMAH